MKERLWNIINTLAASIVLSHVKMLENKRKYLSANILSDVKMDSFGNRKKAPHEMVFALFIQFVTESLTSWLERCPKVLALLRDLSSVPK